MGAILPIDRHFVTNKTGRVGVLFLTSDGGGITEGGSVV